MTWMEPIKKQCYHPLFTRHAPPELSLVTNHPQKGEPNPGFNSTELFGLFLTLDKCSHTGCALWGLPLSSVLLRRCDVDRSFLLSSV